MKNKYLYIVVLALGALLLAACGGGGGEASSNEYTISVVDEFTFEPNAITVKAGETVTVTFENTGSVNHTLNVLKPGAELDHLLEEIKEGEDFDDELLTDMHEIASGSSETVTFTAPSEPGTYEFVCTTPGHIEAGMVGTYEVVP